MTTAKHRPNIQTARTANEFDELFDYAIEQVYLQYPPVQSVDEMICIAAASLHLCASDARSGGAITRDRGRDLHLGISEAARRLFRAIVADIRHVGLGVTVS